MEERKEGKDGGRKDSSKFESCFLCKPEQTSLSAEGRVDSLGSARRDWVRCGCIALSLLPGRRVRMNQVAKAAAVYRGVISLSLVSVSATCQSNGCKSQAASTATSRIYEAWAMERTRPGMSSVRKRL